MKDNTKLMLKSVGIFGAGGLVILLGFFAVTAGGVVIDEKINGEEMKSADEFLNALKYISNVQYKSSANLTDENNYVEGVSSVQYKDKVLTYCAYTNEKMICTSVTSDSFKDENSCIDYLKVNYIDSSKYSTNVSKISSIKNGKPYEVEFESYAASSLYRANATSGYKYKVYEGNSDKELVFSFTYKGTTGDYYSYNEIFYNTETKKFSNDSYYVLDAKDSKAMSYVLNSIK